MALVSFLSPVVIPALASDPRLAWTLDPAPPLASASVCVLAAMICSGAHSAYDGLSFPFQGLQFLGPGPALPPRADLPEAGHLTSALVSTCDTHVLNVYAVLAATLSPACFNPDWLPLDPLGRPDLVQAECPLPGPLVGTAPPAPASSRLGPMWVHFQTRSSLPACPQVTGDKEPVWPVVPRMASDCS